MFKDWVSDENLAQMERWTRHGLSNEQIAKNIGICEQTFYNYKSGTVYGGRKVFLGFPADEKPERFFSETGKRRA